MKKEFESNFNKINENFKFVYKRLFGGGNGELKIVDKNNILESDIEITAQPPGKKMKNLNLLSGEKSSYCYKYIILYYTCKTNSILYIR